MGDPVDDVPWLDARELQVWMALAQLMVKLPVAVESQLQKASGLSLFEYFVLAHLSEAPGRQVRLSELAALSHGSLSRLSHVITRMEKRGFVERRPSEDDARSTDAVLTEAGMATLADAAPGHVRRVRELVLDTLDPDDLDRLGDACRALVARIDALGGPVWQPGCPTAQPSR
jgi:DNA-binding MarR family transcriptional regulator